MTSLNHKLDGVYIDLEVWNLEFYPKTLEPDIWEKKIFCPIMYNEGHSNNNFCYASGILGKSERWQLEIMLPVLEWS